MEIQKYKEIENTIEALNDEFKVLFKEVENYHKKMDNIPKFLYETNSPLIKLISNLTTTARRHDIDKKINVLGEEVIVGTNHQGLGYVEGYSSQLSSLSYGYRYGDTEQKIKDILFNKEATIDLISIIKKSKQKSFLNVIKVLEKNGLKTSFSAYRKKNIQNISINIENTKIIINIDMNSYYIRINLYENCDEDRISSISIGCKNNKFGLFSEKEKGNCLKEISDKNYQDLSIKELKLLFFLSKHKETIFKQIKSSRERLSESIEAYSKEYEELNGLLKPILAFEKL